MKKENRKQDEGRSVFRRKKREQMDRYHEEVLEDELEELCSPRRGDHDKEQGEPV